MRREPLAMGVPRTSDHTPTFPDYESALTTASLVIVPALVLAEGPRFSQALVLVP